MLQVLPLLIFWLWHYTLPIYYLLLGLEIVSIIVAAKNNGRIVLLICIVIVQMFLPYSYFALYSLMPGSGFVCEPIGVSDKAYFAIYISVYLSFLGIIVFIVARILAMRRKRQLVEQGHGA